MVSDICKLKLLGLVALSFLKFPKNREIMKVFNFWEDEYFENTYNNP